MASKARGPGSLDCGRLGVWTFLEGLDAAGAASLVRRVEELGYAALWLPEALGRDPFATLAFAAAHSERLVLATGIANLYARDPMTTHAAARTVNDLSGGRFVLGLGVSHAPVVTGLRGHDYGKPVTTMRAYLDALEKSVYQAVGPDAPPVVLAALRPRMLTLAAECAAGAHPYLVPPEHTARARELLGPDRWLAPEQKVLLETDPARARAIARGNVKMYLQLPNYRNNLEWLGFEDADFQHGGSDRLVDALVAWGDEDALRARVQAHYDAGADHVCIQPLHPEGKPVPHMPTLERLAPGAR